MYSLDVDNISKDSLLVSQNQLMIINHYVSSYSSLNLEGYSNSPIFITSFNMGFSSNLRHDYFHL